MKIKITMFPSRIYGMISFQKIFSRIFLRRIFNYGMFVQQDQLPEPRGRNSSSLSCWGDQNRSRQPWTQQVYWMVNKQKQLIYIQEKSAQSLSIATTQKTPQANCNIVHKMLASAITLLMSTIDHRENPNRNHWNTVHPCSLMSPLQNGRLRYQVGFLNVKVFRFEWIKVWKSLWNIGKRRSNKITKENSGKGTESPNPLSFYIIKFSWNYRKNNEIADHFL